jgi:hypothetical protein
MVANVPAIAAYRLRNIMKSIFIRIRNIHAVIEVKTGPWTHMTDPS